LEITSGSNSVDDYYFLTEPKELSHICFPDNKKWQLLKKPISKKTFVSVPHLRPEYFIHKLKITTNFECVLRTENGQCSVGIKPSDGKRSTDLTYELTFDHRESKQDIPPNVKLHKYVAIMNMKSNETVFDIRFPMAGIYQFRVLDGDHAWVCFFKIVCGSPMAECVPYPMSSVFGFGPCQETKDAGLRPESHQKGLINIGRSKDINIRFTMNNVLSVQATLVHSDITSDQLHKHISHILEHDSVTFTVSVPCEGEYGFQIYCREYLSLEPYRNVCNYLLIYGKPRHKQRQWEVSCLCLC